MYLIFIITKITYIILIHITSKNTYKNKKQNVNNIYVPT